MASQDIYGIDFSGSQSPGKKIWITEATLTATNELEITSVTSAMTRFGETGRAAILESLREFICDAPDAVFGLDFPFGFPRTVIESDSWVAFLERFAEEFNNKTIDAFPGPFGIDGRPKRDIDYRYAGQSPMSPQVQYQVFYGLRDVLWPLVRDDTVSVLPMQSEKEGKPRLLEVYPAATFGRLRLYRTGYKDSDEDSKRRRKANAAGLQAANVVMADDSFEKVVQSDDALDSLCAAFATGTAVQTAFDHDAGLVTGHLYV